MISIGQIKETSRTEYKSLTIYAKYKRTVYIEYSRIIIHVANSPGGTFFVGHSMLDIFSFTNKREYVCMYNIML